MACSGESSAERGVRIEAQHPDPELTCRAIVVHWHVRGASDGKRSNLLLVQKSQTDSFWGE